VAFGGDTVIRIDASDLGLKGGYKSATNAAGVLVARGRIYVTGQTNPGNLYVMGPIAPTPAVPVDTLSNSLGAFPFGIATDGTYVWTANEGPPGSTNAVIAHWSRR
jgi:hypothetical protein